MERIERGMLAWSRAGHDTDTLYLVCGVEGDFVYLCGRLCGVAARPGGASAAVIANYY